MDSTRLNNEEKDDDVCQIALRTDVHLHQDDLSEEAKRKFPFHTEIFQAFQRSQHHVLSNQKLSSIGRHLVCITLEALHTNCKNVLNYMSTQTNVSTTNDVVSSPIIVCGLPRTGTTLLYNLLACDPNCRAPMLADMLDPVPPLVRTDTVKQTERQERLKMFNEIYHVLGLTSYLDEIRGSHPSFVYDEDIYLFGQAGLYLVHYLLISDESQDYAKWFFDESDKDFIYQYHKTFLTMLNDTDAPRSHWLLKTPCHLFFLNILFKYYPRSSLIMTHRRFDEVLPSAARTSIAFTGQLFDNERYDKKVNENRVARSFLKSIDFAIQRLVDFRRVHPTYPVIDVSYEDLVTDPISIIRRIYDHFKLVWSDEFEKSMIFWLLENPQGKQGRNAYSLEDFGLDREKINQKYEKYINMFLDR